MLCGLHTNRFGVRTRYPVPILSPLTFLYLLVLSTASFLHLSWHGRCQWVKGMVFFYVYGCFWMFMGTWTVPWEHHGLVMLALRLWGPGFQKPVRTRTILCSVSQVSWWSSFHTDVSKQPVPANHIRQFWPLKWIRMAPRNPFLLPVRVWCKTHNAWWMSSSNVLVWATYILKRKQEIMRLWDLMGNFWNLAKAITNRTGSHH